MRVGSIDREMYGRVLEIRGTMYSPRVVKLSNTIEEQLKSTADLTGAVKRVLGLFRSCMQRTRN